MIINIDSNLRKILLQNIDKITEEFLYEYLEDKAKPFIEYLIIKAKFCKSNRTKSIIALSYKTRKILSPKIVFFEEALHEYFNNLVDGEKLGIYKVTTFIYLHEVGHCILFLNDIYKYANRLSSGEKDDSEDYEEEEKMINQMVFEFFNNKGFVENDIKIDSFFNINKEYSHKRYEKSLFNSLKRIKYKETKNEELDNYMVSGMFGLAIGDILGVPVKFQSREKIAKKPVKNVRGGGIYDQPPSVWSASTSMALCTLESLFNGLNYEDIMKRFVEYMDDGDWRQCTDSFGIDETTLKAMKRYSKEKIKAIECGEEAANGNGSLARILPISLYEYAIHGFTKDFKIMNKIMEEVYNVSALTHNSKISFIACGIYTHIVFSIINYKATKSLKECVREGMNNAFNYYEKLNNSEFSSQLIKYNRLKYIDNFINIKDNEINSSEYVVDTLEAAIWCVLNTEKYSDCVLKAVNLGGETNTIASLSGGIAGIYYGFHEVIKKWRLCIPKEELKELSNNLYNKLQN